jgi:hypothetical protein
VARSCVSCLAMMAEYSTPMHVARGSAAAVAYLPFPATSVPRPSQQALPLPYSCHHRLLLLLLLVALVPAAAYLAPAHAQRAWLHPNSWHCLL